MKDRYFDAAMQAAKQLHEMKLGEVAYSEPQPVGLIDEVTHRLFDASRQLDKLNALLGTNADRLLGELPKLEQGSVGASLPVNHGGQVAILNDALASIEALIGRVQENAQRFGAL